MLLDYKSSQRIAFQRHSEIVQEMSKNKNIKKYEKIVEFYINMLSVAEEIYENLNNAKSFSLEYFNLKDLQELLQNARQQFNEARLSKSFLLDVL